MNEHRKGADRLSAFLKAKEKQMPDANGKCKKKGRGGKVVSKAADYFADRFCAHPRNARNAELYTRSQSTCLGSEMRNSWSRSIGP